MLRSLKAGARGQTPGASLLLVLLALPVYGALLPDHFGEYMKGEAKTLGPPDPQLYQEYGFQAAEQAEYTTSQSKVTISAWRMRDTTGSMALQQNLGSAAVRHANYVFEFKGDTPAAPDLNQLYAQLPQLEQSALPTLPGFLPKEGLIPNSERYIVGPVSLERFDPQISPSLAAFHLGAEAQIAKYKTAKGDLTLAIFNYPTPSMARERDEQFQKVPGALVKRAGPLVAVTVQPPDTDAAERILARVNYDVGVTFNEKVPENVVKGTLNLIVTGVLLSVAVIALSLVAGIGFGGFRILLRKFGKHEDVDGFTVVRLNTGREAK